MLRLYKFVLHARHIYTVTEALINTNIETCSFHHVDDDNDGRICSCMLRGTRSVDHDRKWAEKRIPNVIADCSYAYYIHRNVLVESACFRIDECAWFNGARKRTALRVRTHCDDRATHKDVRSSPAIGLCTVTFAKGWNLLGFWNGVPPAKLHPSAERTCSQGRRNAARTHAIHLPFV